MSYPELSQAASEVVADGRPAPAGMVVCSSPHTPSHIHDEAPRKEKQPPPPPPPPSERSGFRGHCEGCFAAKRWSQRRRLVIAAAAATAGGGGGQAGEACTFLLQCSNSLRRWHLAPRARRLIRFRNQCRDLPSGLRPVATLSDVNGKGWGWGRGTGGARLIPHYSTSHPPRANAYRSETTPPPPPLLHLGYKDERKGGERDI